MRLSFPSFILMVFHIFKKMCLNGCHEKSIINGSRCYNNILIIIASSNGWRKWIGCLSFCRIPANKFKKIKLWTPRSKLIRTECANDNIIDNRHVIVILDNKSWQYWECGLRSSTAKILIGKTRVTNYLIANSVE